MKSFSVYTDFEQKKKKFFTIGISNIYFLSKILNISFGKLFQFNPINWNRLKTSEGMISSDFTIKDQNLGDFGNFLDITLKLVKTPSISIEPEITLIDNHLSSSLNLNEKNLFGTGISVKQKVYLKKFNPYFFKFEIDDRNLGSEDINNLNQNPRRSLIFNRMKLNLTLNDKSEFFDLNIDPYEEVNRIDDPKYSEIISEMQKKISLWQKNNNDLFRF